MEQLVPASLLEHPKVTAVCCRPPQKMPPLSSWGQGVPQESWPKGPRAQSVGLWSPPTHFSGHLGSRGCFSFLPML